MSRFCCSVCSCLQTWIRHSAMMKKDLEYIVAKQCQNYVSELILQLEEKHKVEIDSVKAQMKELTTKQAEMDVKHNMEMDALRTELTEITTKQAEADETHNFEIHALKDKIKELSVWNNKHITETEALERNMNELNAQQVELGVQVEKLSPTFRTVKDQVEDENSDGNLNSSDLSSAAKRTRVKATKPSREEYKKENQIRRFASDIMHIGADQDIAFDHIVTNIGNAYNRNHGVFIAPVGGTYVFSGTLAVDGSSRSWGHFVVNRQVVAKFYLSPFEQSSQTIVVTLNAGDDVSLQNTVLDRQFLGEGGYSTFGGFLLYEEYANNSVVAHKIHTKFWARNNAKLKHDYVMDSFPTRSKMMCLEECSRRAECISASWNKDDKYCLLSIFDQVNDKGRKSLAMAVEANSAWVTMSKIRTPVFHATGKNGRYTCTLTFTEAKKLCETRAGVIASVTDMEAARSLGYGLCICGWLAEGRIGLVLQQPDSTCMSYYEESVLFCNWLSTANVYCKFM